MMNEPKFKIGDIVCLKSGGPKMTIDRVENGWGNQKTEKKEYKVCWFNEQNELQYGTFSEDSLEKKQ